MRAGQCGCRQVAETYRRALSGTISGSGWHESVTAIIYVRDPGKSYAINLRGWTLRL